MHNVRVSNEKVKAIRPHTCMLGSLADNDQEEDFFHVYIA